MQHEASAWPARTAVISAAMGYSLLRFVAFVVPLRLNYDGDVILLVGPNNSEAVLTLCEEKRVTLNYVDSGTLCHTYATLDRTSKCPGFALSRFRLLAESCRGYDLCFSIDFRDVVFQADPFASLRGDLFAKHRKAGLHGKIMIFAEEASEKTIQSSFFNAQWAVMCYGKDSLSGVFKRRPIINSGSIFASSAGFAAIAEAYASPSRCPAANGSNFHGVDQIILNWMVYSGHLEQHGFVAHAQRRGEGVVNTLRYTLGPTRQKMIEAANMTRDTRVLHQYDSLPFLQKALEREAASYISARFPAHIEPRAEPSHTGGAVSRRKGHRSATPARTNGL